MRIENLTTLIYITRGSGCLFIRKTRKGDMNLDKYLGIGGHFESDETAEECVLRELSEEAAIPFTALKEFSYRGLITFISSEYPTEYMHVFSAAVDEDYERWSAATSSRASSRTTSYSHSAACLLPVEAVSFACR